MTTKIRTTVESTADREIVVSRLLNAPRELVYKAWTDPKQVPLWWGPNGFSTSIHEMDVRPGGVWRFVMIGPDGTQYNDRIVYTEVVAPERLVYEHGSDIENDPQAFHSTVTFEDRDGRTLVTLRAVFQTAEARNEAAKYAIEGGKQTLGRLADHLPGMAATKGNALQLSFPSDHEIVMTRVFDAPRRLVFEALSRPEHIRQWYGLSFMKMTVCEMDARPGGKWRYVVQAPDGGEYGFSGVIQEIVPVERMVFTECFEAMPGHDYLVTTTLAERAGKTVFTSHLLYKTPEDRDGHLNSGMETGAAESYDRLAALLATLA